MESKFQYKKITSIRIGLLLMLTTLAFSLSTCKKKPEVIPDNDAPYYSTIPTVQVENYINRIFIDLIGREPTDIEMANEFIALRAAKLSTESREFLINKLQTDLTFVEGDTSYFKAYHHWFYEMTKARMIEGASDLDIRDAMTGDDSLRLAKLQAVLDINQNFMDGSIDLAGIFSRLLDNYIYDFLNMMTFNFVNSSFDNLYYRAPTSAEFQTSFDMIEYNVSLTLLEQAGANKQDYIYILTNTREFYEGLVIWSYRSLLARSPTSWEVDNIMLTFYNTANFKWVQKEIMKTDEYADF